CTKPAAVQAPATDSRNTACKPPGCVPLARFPPPPCVRLVHWCTLVQRLRPEHPSAGAACMPDRPRRAPPPALHCAAQPCARRCRSRHPTPPDRRVPFRRAAIPALSYAVGGGRGRLEGRDKNFVGVQYSPPPYLRQPLK